MQFFKGREAIKAFLRRKWEKELDYALMKVGGVRDHNSLGL